MWIQDKEVTLLRAITTQVTQSSMGSIFALISYPMLGGEHHHQVPGIAENVNEPDKFYNPRALNKG